MSDKKVIWEQKMDVYQRNHLHARPDRPERVPEEGVVFHCETNLVGDSLVRPDEEIGLRRRQTGHSLKSLMQSRQKSLPACHEDEQTIELVRTVLDEDDCTDVMLAHCTALCL